MQAKTVEGWQLQIRSKSLMIALRDSEKCIIVMLEVPEVKQNVSIDLLLKRRMENLRTVP